MGLEYEIKKLYIKDLNIKIVENNTIKNIFFCMKNTLMVTSS